MDIKDRRIKELEDIVAAQAKRIEEVACSHRGIRAAPGAQ